MIGFKIIRGWGFDRFIKRVAPYMRSDARSDPTPSGL